MPSALVARSARWREAGGPADDPPPTCQHVGPGPVEVGGDLGQLLADSVDQPVVLGVDRGGVGLVIERVQQSLTQGQDAFGVADIKFAA